MKRRSVSASATRSIGLVTQAFMPAARHASRSAFIALAVIAMIGRSSNEASARSVRVASRPSITGICMSISTAA